MQYRPYVGDSYTIKGGDWVGGTLVADAALIAGPTYATRVSGGSLAPAEQLPALISLTASFTYLATAGQGCSGRCYPRLRRRVDV